MSLNTWCLKCRSRCRSLIEELLQHQVKSRWLCHIWRKVEPVRGADRQMSRGRRCWQVKLDILYVNRFVDIRCRVVLIEVVICD